MTSTTSSSPQAVSAAAPAPQSTASSAASTSASMLPSIPDILYGTAWKDTRTTTLVFTAITAGFRGIDTAGQRKHYREELVGQALHQLEEAGVARREEVWLQTKFTSKDGQDLSGPVPYDPRWPVRKQIRHSAFASLRNLHVSDRWDKAELLEAAKQAAGLAQTSGASAANKGKGRSVDYTQSALGRSSANDEGEQHPSGLPDFAKFRPIGAISPDGKTRPWLDSYLLHSPLRSLEETLQAWQEMELLVQEGWVRHIGFSNVYDSRIWNALLQSINIRPLALQNRWHSSSGHDVSLLSTLSPILSPNDSEGHAIHYQPFWTLTGNPALLRSEPVVRAAIAHDWTPAQVVYKFVNQGMGIQGLRCCVLTGTTDEKHMRQAVQVVNNRHGESHLLTVGEVNEIRKQVYGE
ncbi:hypothetical protein CBOM_04358 [Ceraceosorus bombacis]|uniref:NADP-dependent oxidoreductase domain-containing protein n=1 Tax=Ceraceosorus bombacis TaxID=401625 RepID=A0A0P1BGZ3_9BASI|nr:hypothetical protein CBOM_04358 [Ceraceosorus bombacis]